MKIRLSQIYKVTIILFIFLSVGISKVLAGIPFISTERGITYLSVVIVAFLFFIYCLWQKCYKCKYINFLCGHLLIMLTIECIYTGFRYNYSSLDYFYSNERFCYVLLAGMIFYILKMHVWSMERLFKIILGMTTVSYLIRIGISAFYGITGTKLFNEIILESASEDWIRNGVLRINPPCFAVIFIPIATWMLIQSKTLKQKIWYLVLIGVSLYYTFNVHIARSLMIYQSISIILMILFYRRMTRKKLITVLIISIIMICIVNSGFFLDFLDSFSVSNDQTGSSTFARLYVIGYFNNLWKENWLLGIGGLSENDLCKNLITGHIADIGYLANIFRFGVFGILLGLLLFGRWVYIASKLYRMKNKYLTIAIGITSSYLMFDLNIDLFYAILKFSVPFAIAIMEYIYSESIIQNFGGNKLTKNSHQQE